MMALVTRVSRLFKADMHAVLDRIEEPEVLLRQAVREMEEALGCDEQRLRLLRHGAAERVARIADGQRTLAKIDGELDICFEAGDEQLARVLVRRKLEARQALDSHTRRRHELERTVAEVEDRVGENRTRLEAMRQKLSLLDEEDTREYPGEPAAIQSSAINDHDVEIALLREKHERGAS
jgi:phage shock protein A